MLASIKHTVVQDKEEGELVQANAVLPLMLQNPTIDVNVTSQVSGVNSFWMAAYYG